MPVFPMYKGPGGHSTPSATHALGRAIADLKTPSEPKTTFSVGEITDGTFGGAHMLEEWRNPENGHSAIQKRFLSILGMDGIPEVIRPLLVKKMKNTPAKAIALLLGYFNCWLDTIAAEN